MILALIIAFSIQIGMTINKKEVPTEATKTETVKEEIASNENKK